MFCPSDNFHQYCADLSKAFSADAKQGTYVDENNWLRSWSHETYLWYDEIEDVDPACCTTPEYFELMKTKETTSSGKPKDRFHFSQPTREYRQLSNEGITAGYGARFKALRRSPPRNVVVAYTEPGSPATAASVNLVRGTQILGVDGIDIVNSTDEDEVDKINAALNPSVGDTHTFIVKDPGSFSQERSVTMTAKEITVHPVQKVKIITTSEGDRVGYMLFNAHNDPAAQPLISAGNTFRRGRGINDLVLDLRYNNGGFTYIAQIITSIIAGSAGNGKNFAIFEYNDKTDNRSAPFAGAFRDENGTVHRLPYLDLPRLFVLTSPSTCSASELIINSLRGIDIDVILVGSTTCGKYHGFVSTDNCGTTYSTIQLRVVNNKGVADYDDGFSPTCSVADNDYDHQLGDSEESLLKTALAYQADDACPSSSSAQVREAATKSSQEESLSIDPVPSPYSSLPGLILDR
ncbi:MAG: peptidase [Candidatus Dadabacteria bacterium]|nr:peptidase [Candidatus Dadabacteria bacterium]